MRGENSAVIEFSSRRCNKALRVSPGLLRRSRSTSTIRLSVSATVDRPQLHDLCCLSEPLSRYSLCANGPSERSRLVRSASFTGEQCVTLRRLLEREAAVGTRNAATNRKITAATMLLLNEIGKSCLPCVLLIVVAGLLSCAQTRYRLNQVGAQSSLRLIRKAQTVYRSHNQNRFGTLQELHSADLIDAELASGTKRWIPV
jgi:hypothetical protein